ncbi:DUF3455 domain-containing protein [Bradyrhizobium sp. GCM10027634]|uniref:DUF3455 domain-containing protein n=1 Tax=unclassified Bradyrhizobium TaxID=2631580 RepID=UPI001FEF8ECB|nr:MULTISPECIES: DUF3455 domain-containing protein [unclassified Bradyrhizobium]MDN5001572.1 DUF3455 domain-containing protein [Bradyrhizobium sp. WYCCWR 12677]
MTVALMLGRGVVVASALLGASALAGTPDEIRVPGEIPGTVLHAEGAQIYECRRDAAHQLVWQMREPTATLIDRGNSVGRHSAALHWDTVDATTLVWEHKDGSSVMAKIVAQAASRSADDLPWLKLGVITQSGDGQFYGVSHVQRINTRGGVAGGTCEQAGTYRSVPYSADYVFWRVE